MGVFRSKLCLTLEAVSERWLLVSLFLLAGTTFFSLLPLAVLPEVPGTDKTHHLLSYAAIMFPIALRKRNYFFAIFIGLMLWGGAIELIQPYVNRYAEWLDFYANTLGLIIGCLLAHLARRLLPSNLK